MFYKMKIRSLPSIFLFLGSFITGILLQTNWLHRHEYWGFFHSKFLVNLRIAFSGFMIFLVAWLLHKALRFCLEQVRESKKHLYLNLDILSCVILPFFVYYRSHIPGRHEGNLYYIWVFSTWFAIKPSLWLGLLNFREKLSFLKQIVSIPKQIIKSFYWLNSRIRLNGYYYLAGFIFLCIQSVLFIRITPQFENHFLLYFSVILPYCLAFIGLSIILISYAKHFFSKPGLIIASSLVFMSWAAYWLDYTCYTLVNMHLPEMFTILFGEGLGNIAQILEGAGVSLSFFFLSLVLIALLPFVGLLIYNLTDKLNSKHPLYIKAYSPILFTLAFVGWAFLGDYNLTKKLSTPTVRKFQTTAPLAGILYPAKSNKLPMPGVLIPPPDESSYKKALTEASLNTQKAPHIFVFVIESLREDFINSDTAPFLSKFRDENISFEWGLSNANITHGSWFGIFYSLHPYHWYNVRGQPHQRMGAFPLRVLKELGYKEYVYSSATNLSYYDIGEVIFGSDYYLLNDMFQAKEQSTDIAYCDRLAINALKAAITKIKPEDKTFHTIFLDSTHHSYYWPEDFQAKFEPYTNNFNYFGSGAKQLEMTKNRYRNSISYVDTLVEEIVTSIKNQGLYDNSIIIVTGDHGEEFLETGHYFHGNALCMPQSHVVLYYKFPENSKQTATNSSHIDIFPSVFDYMSLDSSLLNLMDGQSIFDLNDRIILSIKPSGGKDPYQFYLHNGKEKLIAHFAYKESIYDATAIDLIDITDNKDQTISLGQKPSEQKEAVLKRFGNYLDKMFEPPHG